MNKKLLVVAVFFNAIVFNCALLFGQDNFGIEASSENCKMYEENSYWLPDPYISNATCACETMPNDPKANKIRKVLQDQLSRTNIAFIENARLKKLQYQSKEISKHKYNVFIKKTLTPIIYSDHVLAYALADCKGDPAPYWTWKTVSKKRIKKCDRIWFYIRYFGGSCSKKLGKW